MYISVFLVWNQYGNLNRNLKFILKGIGFTGLIVLLAVFRSGTPESDAWIETGWWGILGLIGWGYFVTALVYLFVKDKLFLTGLFWLFFILLNVFSQLRMLGFLDFTKPVFGVIIDGNTPSIVMAGLFFSLVFRKLNQSKISEIYCSWFVTGSFVLIFRLYFPELVYYFKNSGNPKLGNDL